jgi:hypothetical protein
MLKKTLISVSLLAALAASAQTLPPAPSTAGSPGKKDAIARILKAQQPAIEALARGMVERPALEIMSSAASVLPARIPKEKQDAVGKEIEADIRRYVDESVPVVQRRAVALAPSTIGAVLEEKFSEDELKQIASALENPALVKYQGTVPVMQQSLGEKLVAETRPQIEPKVKALEEQVGKRLGITNGAAAPAPAAPAKKK